MSTTAVEAFDLRSAPDELLVELHALELSYCEELDPGETPRPFENYAAAVRNMPTTFTIDGFLARGIGGQVTGAAEVTCVLGSESERNAQLDLTVRASDRRQGIGRELLRKASEAANERGRSMILAVTDNRIPAGESFANAFGGTPGLVNRVSRLVLRSVDRSLLDQWVRQGQHRASAYSLIEIDGACPDDLVAQFTELQGAMNDAPTGELVTTDRSLTIEELRETEAQRVAMGTRTWRIVAKHEASDELVGFTEVTWSPSNPHTVRQGDTAVDRRHRGHGLGKWLKAAMLQLILDSCPQARDIRTLNAEQNAAMFAINSALGFAPFNSRTVWQAPLSAVRERLDGSN